MKFEMIQKMKSTFEQEFYIENVTKEVDPIIFGY